MIFIQIGGGAKEVPGVDHHTAVGTVRQTHDLGKHLLANSPQLTSLVQNCRDASPDVIARFLRQLDVDERGLGATRGRISSGSDASRAEKDSGVGRTDESLRHDDEDHSCCEQVR